MRELTLRFESTWGLGSELAFVSYQFEDEQAYRHFCRQSLRSYWRYIDGEMDCDAAVVLERIGFVLRHRFAFDAGESAFDEECKVAFASFCLLGQAWLDYDVIDSTALVVPFSGGPYH